MKLKEYLDTQQVTIKQMSKKAGVAEYTIRSVIKGLRPPRDTTLWKLSNATKRHELSPPLVRVDEMRERE